MAIDKWESKAINNIQIPYAFLDNMFKETYTVINKKNMIHNTLPINRIDQSTKANNLKRHINVCIDTYMICSYICI